MKNEVFQEKLVSPMKKEIGNFEVVNEEALDEICAGIESLSFGDVGKFTLLDTSGRQIMVEARSIWSAFLKKRWTKRRWKMAMVTCMI